MSTSKSTTTSSKPRSTPARSSGTARSPRQSASKSKPLPRSRTPCPSSAPAWSTPPKDFLVSPRSLNYLRKSQALVNARRVKVRPAKGSPSVSILRATKNSLSAQKTLRRRVQHKLALARYQQTSKGRETYRRYDQTSKRNEADWKYDHSPKGVERIRRYQDGSRI